MLGLRKKSLKKLQKNCGLDSAATATLPPGTVGTPPLPGPPLAVVWQPAMPVAGWPAASPPAGVQPAARAGLISLMSHQAGLPAASRLACQWTAGSRRVSRRPSGLSRSVAESCPGLAGRPASRRGLGLGAVPGQTAQP